MKENLIYFSHDSDASNNARMKALRAQFGWEGYGRFWALNEAVARSKNVCLDLGTKVQRSSLANDLGFTVAQLDAFLTFLADPEECGLIHYVDGVVTTDKTKEDHARVMKDRDRKKKDGHPVIDFFPDENNDHQPVSEPELETGAEVRKNGSEESRIVEHRRVEQSKTSSPVVEFEVFLPDEKKISQSQNTTKTPDSDALLTPSPQLRMNPAHLAEAVSFFGPRTQEALDLIALKIRAHGYGYAVPWDGAKGWFVNAGGPVEWLDKLTGKARESPGPPGLAYQPFHHEPGELASAEPLSGSFESGEDFVKRARLGREER